MNHDKDCGHTDAEHREMERELEEIVRQGMADVETHKEEAGAALARVLAGGDVTDEYIQDNVVLKVALTLLTQLVSRSFLPEQMPAVVAVVRASIGLTLFFENTEAFGQSRSGSSDEVPEIFRHLDLPGLDTL